MKTFDVIVIGGGPAGYVCSIKCAQLGLKVACVEKREFLGGTCLNEGCIPSKTLLNSSYLYYQAREDFKKLGINCGELSVSLDEMMKNKLNVVSDLANGINFLFKKNSITRFLGVGKIISPNGEVSINGAETIQAKNIVIATGSESTPLPGIEFDEDVILSSKGALELQSIPESMIVVGAGAIGLEMASVWSRLGAKVEVVEYMDRVAATMDHDLSAQLLKSLKNQGIEFHLSSKIKNVVRNIEKKGVIATVEENGQGKNLVADKVLVSIGRKPYSADLGIEIIRNQRGFIKVDENFQTNIPGVYAIGDVITGPMLAHKAEEEGVAVAEILSGRKTHIGWIPSVIYTHPEVASVGKTEDEVKNLGVKYKVSKFPFVANSRAKTNNDTEGFVKIIVDEYDTILGVHIIGPSAATIIAEAVLAMEYGASAEDIARTCHSHPDLNEALKEAALGAFFKPLHS